jgi:hypothetical protein
VQLFVVGQSVKNFLLGLVADGAGVIENQSGLFDGLNLSVALGKQRPYDLFGVVGVHLAAKGFEVEGLAGLTGHINKYSARRKSAHSDGAEKHYPGRKVCD